MLLLHPGARRKGLGESSAPEVNLYVEFTDRKNLEAVLQLCQEKQVKILNLEVTRSSGSERHNACALLSLRLTRRVTIFDLLEGINTIPGVIAAEEL